MAAEQVEAEVHPDPEQPGAEPPRRVEPVEPVVHLPERLLRQVAREFLVADQAGQHADELPLVPRHQGGEGPVVPGPGQLDQPGVTRLGRSTAGAAGSGGPAGVADAPDAASGSFPGTDSADFRIA